MRRSRMPARKTPLRSGKVLERAAAWGLPKLAVSRLHRNQARESRTKRRTVGRPTIPPKVRFALAVRSEGTCEIAQPGCTAAATDASHRLKVGMGGRKRDAAAKHHVLSQLLHACRTCHSRLHAEPAGAYAAGWMLREGQSSTSEPVVYRGQVRWLTDGGSVLTSDPKESPMAATNYVQAVTTELAAQLDDCDSDLLSLYALLALTRGPATTLEDVHDAWAIWRNTSDPEHRSLVPFEQLTPDVQELDRKYQVAIHCAAKAVAR